MGLLDKLLFWPTDDRADVGVEGCFTFPGAELDHAEAGAAPPAEDPAEA